MRMRLKLNAGMDFTSVFLTEMKFHVGWLLCKHYPKWNAYKCRWKYRVVLNAAQMKLHVNRTCFDDGLKSQTGISSFCLSCERTLKENEHTVWGGGYTWIPIYSDSVSLFIDHKFIFMQLWEEEFNDSLQRARRFSDIPSTLKLVRIKHETWIWHESQRNSQIFSRRLQKLRH